MIRVGIMGCAAIARRSLAPAFRAHGDFSIAAIASRTPSKAQEFAAAYAARPCSYDELVSADDIDMVYCPLPTGMHREWVGKCLLAGKHVLCEKSLATSRREVEELVEAARARNLLLMESFQFRFHAQNLYVKELLAAGAIGEIRQLTVRFGIPPFPEGAKNIRYSKELGGGALLDNGAYTIKCATYLFGKKNARVLAAVEGGAVPDLGNVNLTGAMMLTVDGIPVQTAYGFDHFYQNSYEIWGKDGKISTVRAFTAREDFSAPVTLEAKAGKEVKTFNDDHFARLLDYVAKTIPSGCYEPEYEECLIQAKLLEDAHDCAVRG